MPPTKAVEGLSSDTVPIWSDGGNTIHIAKQLANADRTRSGSSTGLSLVVALSGGVHGKSAGARIFQKKRGKTKKDLPRVLGEV